MVLGSLTHPEILHVLKLVGHGDRIAIVDSNYPCFERRHPAVRLVTVNIARGLVDAPTVLRLVAAGIPIEKLVYPRPTEEESSGVLREVHAAFRGTRDEVCPSASVEAIAPLDFYALTSGTNLAVMIKTGEHRHFGSAVVTVGYLPES